MGKFLLILLLCISYHATASIILVPVSFSQTPTSTTPTETTEATSTSSGDSSTAPVSEETVTSSTIANDQPAFDSTTNTQVVDASITNSDTSLTTHQESRPTANADQSYTEGISVKEENNQQLSGSEEAQSQFESFKDKRHSHNSNRRAPIIKINNPARNRWQDPLGFARSIVLMKEFPEKNAILSNSNINFVERKFVLQKDGPFKLTFTAFVVPSQTNQPLNRIQLIIDLNGITNQVPLAAGQKTHVVSLNGQKGVNSMIFSLAGQSKGLGLVSVILNQFKLQ